jgi:hypothetical protein
LVIGDEIPDAPREAVAYLGGKRLLTLFDCPSLRELTLVVVINQERDIEELAGLAEWSMIDEVLSDSAFPSLSSITFEISFIPNFCLPKGFLNPVVDPGRVTEIVNAALPSVIQSGRSLEVQVDALVPDIEIVEESEHVEA